jgi:hypothetical protein
MRRFLSILFVLGLILSFNLVAVPAAAASDVWVDDVTDPLEDGTIAHPYDSIQEGIDNVDAGGTVHVLAGTYYENITLRDGVDVMGEDGASDTTIDGGGTDVVVFADGIGAGTTLDGFTITNGDSGYGGGMLSHNSSLTVSNCTFTTNTAGIGGGMYNTSSWPTLTGCTFTTNTAYDGGGMYNDYSSSPTLTNCTFATNTAGNYGGGMYNVDSSPVLTDCTFATNTAYYGGGMYNEYYSSPTLTNCVFTGNSVSWGGGMMNYDNSSPTLTDCTFTTNSASFGGGMLNYVSSSPVLTNCTFATNTAGGGMYNGSSSSPVVTNCIFWDNGVEIYNVSSTPVVTYCDIQGGYSGTGNIDEVPMFAGGGDYHLQPGSPCIDAGDNSAPFLPGTDFEGDPRIWDGDGDGDDVVDMGVDEYYVPRRTVGGGVYPVDKAALLMPWLGLGLVLVLAAGGLILVGRRSHR